MKSLITLIILLTLVSCKKEEVKQYGCGKIEKMYSKENQPGVKFYYMDRKMEIPDVIQTTQITKEQANDWKVGYRVCIDSFSISVNH